MSQSKVAATIRDLFQLPAHLAMAFPLLTRELIEQSARRRTFILRTVYAAAIYIMVFWSFWSEVGSWSTNSFRLLGRGRELFQALVALQFVGVYLFLPAMTSGVIAIEKERDTLSLLLLTRLGAWSILLGKLFSRLIPMASFLLLSLPLVAVAYSMGGVEFHEILGVVWALFATSLQVGAIALACSTWFRTTAQAFMATYLIGAGLILAPALLTQNGENDPYGIVSFVGALAVMYGIVESSNYREVVSLLVGPWICNQPAPNPFGMVLLRSVPMMVFTGMCLVFAHVVLWRRAFVQPSNLLLKWFRSLDKLFHRLNQNRFTKGIVLTHEDVALPHYDPIRWRETKKRSLGTTRYLIRFLLLLEVPVCFGMLYSVATLDFEGRGFNSAHVVPWLLWCIVTLLLVIQSTGLVGAEKSKQTLDVLLTVPMSSETIVREKFAGIWRMIRMLWIPFGTAYLFQILWTTAVHAQPDDAVFGIARALLATTIYPPLIAALGFHFGMRCRSQTQAVLVTLSIIAVICAVPPLVVALFSSMNAADFSLFSAFRWLSPVTVVTKVRAEYYYLNNGTPYSESGGAWCGMLFHFMICGACLSWLWWQSLSTFAACVHRNDGQIVDDDDIERLSQLRQKIVGGGIFRASAEE